MTATAEPSPNAVEIQGLGKRFGNRWAVRDLDLAVAPGDIYGFLGPNGAGKTTVIRLMLGLLRPTTGRVRIFGHDVATDRMNAARLIGSLLEGRATYDNLTGRENLDSTRRLLGLPAGEIERVLEIVEMTNAADRKVGHYSLGMRQRLGLARALLGRPRLLVLDEPMNGLDPDGIREMREVIRDLPARSNVTIFLSSHLLSEVQQTASHVALLQDGRLVLHGALNDLLARASSELHIRSDDHPRTARILSDAGYQANITPTDICLMLRGDDNEVAAVNKRLVAADISVFELSRHVPTLEALYMQVQETQTQERLAA